MHDGVAPPFASRMRHDLGTNVRPDPLVETTAGAAHGVDLGLSALYRSSPGPGPRLRVGVMLDGLWTIRCFRHVIEDIRQSDFAELAAVVLNDASADEAARRLPRWRRYWNVVANDRSRRALAYTVYTRFVDRLPDPALDPLAIVPCEALLRGLPTVSVRPLTSRFVHRFPDDAVAGIASLDLDVLLRFGFNILRGRILDVPRYGIWSYHHGDPDAYRGGPAQFWEIVERNPVSGAMLQVLTEELDAGLVLCKGLFATTRSASLVDNRLGPYWGSQHFVIQKLNELHRHGWDHVRERAVPLAPYAGRRLPYRTPANAEFLGWAAREVATRAAHRLGRARTYTDWNVAIRGLGRSLLDEEGSPPLADFRVFGNPPGRFLADPFLLEDGEDTWLFVEDYGFDDRKGVISCGRLAPDGSVDALTPCLERPYHLSYPGVFRHGGETWLVPESVQSGTIDLYRAVAFPWRWRLERTLLRFRGVDPTVFRHDGRWWLAVTHTPVSGHEATTVLFVADDLTGPWRLHPSSPLSCDVRNSRSAGPLFVDRGRLIRPSQDSAHHYGRALVLNEVLELGGATYRERILCKVEADGLPSFDGVHHYHRVGRWEVIDARRQARLARFRERPERSASGELAAVPLVALPPGAVGAAGG